MIAGHFHEGSGLGNQLHRYVATRVLAEEKGFDWSMICGDVNRFKGKEFMPIQYFNNASKVNKHQNWVASFDESKFHKFIEKKVVENGIDIRSYDPEFNFIEDNTIIDGEFQDERYWNHRIDDVRNWLAVEPLYMRPDVCVIGFRGGEYTIFPELYLDPSYWENAITVMKMRNPNMMFEVHTDDPESARKMLEPVFEAIESKFTWKFKEVTYTHDIGLNWRSVRYAKYLIIANSSFYIFPALLNTDLKAKVIAPRYWARRSANPPVWAQPQNYYKQFQYI